MRDACGAAGTVPSAYEAYKARSLPQDFESFWANEAKSGFNTLWNQDVKIRSALYAELLALSQVKLSEAFANQKNLQLAKVLLLDRIAQNISFLEVKPGDDLYPVPSINDKKLDAFLSSKPKDLRDPLVQYVQAVKAPPIQFMATSRIVLMADPVRSGFLRLYLQFAKPRIPYEAAYKQVVEDAFGLIQNAEAKFPGSPKIFLDPFQISILTRAHNGASLKPFEEDKLAMALINLPVLSLIQDEGFLDKLNRWSSAESMEVMGGVEINPLKTDLLSWAKQEDVQSARSKFDTNCKTALARFSMTRPTESELNRFSSTLQLVLTHASRVAFEITGSSDISNRIKDTKFFLPLTWTDEKANFLQSLSLFQGNNDGLLRTLATSDKEIRHLMLMSNVNQGINSPSANRVCNDDYGVVGVTDYTIIMGKGKIATSWFSVVYPDIGAGMVAHELGHALSGLVKIESAAGSVGNYMPIRACVTHRNPNFISAASPTTFPGDSFWSEEDMADFFSSNVLRSIGVSNYPNMGCAFVPVSQGDYSSEKLNIAPVEGDPHSSGFLRMLFLAVDQSRAIPASCKKILDSFPQADVGAGCR